jgi:hypothetical protein
MKLSINFGLSIKKQVDWHGNLMDFPKLLRLKSSKWEWVIYAPIGKDYELTYSEIPTYDPNYYVDMPSFEDMFEGGLGSKCECGSAYTSFSFDHLKYCPRHIPWDRI